MNQEKRLNEVDKINLKIANLKQIIQDFEVDILILLTKCTHVDGSRKSAIGEDDVCWICQKKFVSVKG